MTNFRNAMMAAAYTASASGVTIENSALFSAVNQSLSRSQGSGSNTVWTFSSWIYKCESKNQVFLNSGSSPEGQLGWDTSDRLYIYNGSTIVALTTQVFRDIGWYHIHIAYNTSASGTDKVKLSVNGSLVSAFDTDNRSSAGAFNNMNQSGQTLRLGNNGSDSGTVCLSGFMAETVILDGTASQATSFAEYDSTGTYWTPLASATIKALTFGTNGFYLDNTTNAETSATGSNSFTNNNTVTTTSLMTPTKLPRLLWNPLSPAFAGTLSQGNTKLASSGVHQGAFANTNFPKTGKWQTEVLVDVSGSSSAIVSFAIMPSLSSESLNQYIGDNSDSYGFYVYPTNQAFYSGTSSVFTTGSVARSTFKYQICWDASAGDGTADVYFGIDNTFYDNDGSTDGNPATGANPTIENLDISTSEWNLLGIPYDAGTLTTADEADWEYSIQSGYTALNLTNVTDAVTLPTSTIDDHFRTILYTGNGSTQTITTTIRPDFIWTKNRTSSGPAIVDAVRGPTKSVQTNSSGNEFTSSNSITSLGATSYDLGSDGDHGSFNDNGDAHVAWVAQLGGVPSATNSAGAGATPTANSVKIDGSNLGSALAGTIPVTKLSASTEFGMSVISYTGNGSAGATFFHGLSATPQMYWVKGLDGGDHFYVYHSGVASDAETDALLLNGTSGSYDDATLWNDTAPTSSVISLGSNNGVNQSGKKYLAIAFAPSAFCMVTSWLGNNNSNGTFVPTVSTLSDGIVPMEPRWALIKQSSAAGQNWYMYDRVRDPINPMTRDLRANAATAESGDSSDSIDFLTSGIKFYSNHSGTNAAQTYVALIFGQPIISKDKTLLAGR